MNQMGNLEKFGILVIVILVVVVGVVAITPKDQVDAALFPTDAPPPADAERVDPLTDVGVQDGGVAGGTEVGTGDATATDARGWPIPPAGATASDLPPASGGTLGGSSGTGTGTGTNAAGGQGGTSTSVAPPVPAAPQATEYTVQKGDTPSKIAAKLLGRASLWTLIAEANPGLDPKRMKIGQVLKIPARPDAQGATAQAPQPTPVQGVVPPTPPTTTVTEPASTAERTIVVQPGETLTGISRRELKSSARWREIQALNEDVLHGSDKLRGGMKLRIPALGASAASAPASSAGGTATTTGRTYKVQKGDSLTSIASRFLGTGSRWREILKANDSVLHGSDTIREGMELVIPDQVSAR